MVNKRIDEVLGVYAKTEGDIKSMVELKFKESIESQGHNLDKLFKEQEERM